MSYSSSTTNYHLPQFAGTDKPTWGVDINGAFETIDTTMKSISEGSGSEALEIAQAAQAAAAAAQVTANSAQSTANAAAKLQVTSTDPGEGVPLAANTMIAVVEA